MRIESLWRSALLRHVVMRSTSTGIMYRSMARVAPGMQDAKLGIAARKHDGLMATACRTDNGNPGIKLVFNVCSKIGPVAVGCIDCVLALKHCYTRNQIEDCPNAQVLAPSDVLQVASWELLLQPAMISSVPASVLCDG